MSEQNPTSLAEKLKIVLREYKREVEAEIQRAKGKFMEMHETTRQIYEHQLELIDELEEVLDTGEEL